MVYLYLVLFYCCLVGICVCIKFDFGVVVYRFALFALVLILLVWFVSFYFVFWVECFAWIWLGSYVLWLLQVCCSSLISLIMLCCLVLTLYCYVLFLVYDWCFGVFVVYDCNFGLVGELVADIIGWLCWVWYIWLSAGVCLFVIYVLLI